MSKLIQLGIWGLGCLAALGLVVAILPRRWQQSILNWGIPSQDWMEPFRARLVNAVIVVFLIAPSLYAIVQRRDEYPYSNYPMYSTVERGSDVTVVLAYGTLLDDTTREFQLADDDYIEPFQQGRLRRVLAALSRKPYTDTDRKDFLKVLLERYQSRRLSDKHDGPAISGIRVYKVRWELDPELKNRDTPTQRDLLYAYEL